MKTSTRHRSGSWTIILVAAALAAPVFLPGPTALAQSESVHATLLIFSGRENPQIELGSEELAQLRAFVGDLAENPRFDGDSVNPSILGYSGFVVVNDAKDADLPEYLAVFGSDVEASGPDGRRFYRDQNRNIENWMVQRFMARDLIDDQSLKLIRSAQK